MDEQQAKRILDMAIGYFVGVGTMTCISAVIIQKMGKENERTALLIKTLSRTLSEVLDHADTSTIPPEVIEKIKNDIDFLEITDNM